MNKQLDDMTKRTYSYFYVDGLVEAATGFLFLTIGLVLLGWINLEKGGWVQITAVIALPLVILGGTFLIKHVVSSLKERITYPRTGYVAYRPSKSLPGRWVVVGTSFVLILLLFIVPDWLNRMAAVQGALLCIILVAIGYQVSVSRFYIFGGIALTIGITTAFLVNDEIVGSVITFIITGASMFLLGTIVFLNYLHHHPHTHQEEV